MAYTTKESVLKLGHIDPELAAVLSKISAPAPDFSDIIRLRNGTSEQMAAAMAKLGPPPPSIQKSVHHITSSDGDDGRTIRALVYRPTTPPPSGSPLIVTYHGGGYCIGAPEGEERSCCNFVLALGAVAVSLEYRLAPEFPFPTGIHDAWDGLRWAARHAKQIGADPSRGFLVGGTSAGGNFAAVLSLLARDENLSPPLTGQFLTVPNLLPYAVTPEKYQPLHLSGEQNNSAPILNTQAMNLFMSNYKPDLHSSLYVPFNHPKGLAGLPPAYFQVCGMDMMRDEALIYERVLRNECAIPTRLDVYPGLPHGFWVHFNMLPAAMKFMIDLVHGLGWLLGVEPDTGKIENALEGAVV